MSITARVTAGLLSLVLLGAVLEWSQLGRIRELQSDLEALGAVDLQVSRRSLEIRRLVTESDEYRRKYLVLRDPGYAERLRELETRVSQEIEQLARLDLPADGQELARQLTEDWHGATNEIDSERWIAELRGHLDRLDELSARSIEARIDEAEERAARARRDSLLWAAISVFGATALALIVGRSVGEPINRLSMATRKVASGDLDVRVSESGSSEIADLAADFNVMTNRLSELDRMKQDFVSSVSHDLKAPLASMRETTQLLLEGEVGEINDTQHELLELTLESCDRLSDMIGDLLDTARLSSGSAFDLASLDLRDVVAEAVAEARTLAAGVEIRLARGEAELPIRGDRALLLQLLRNLLSNAIRHSPAGESVGVDCGSVDCGRWSEGERALGESVQAVREVEGPSAWVAVSDRGPGVVPGNEKLIFEPFFRSPEGGRRGKGSGLGLSIAKRIATGHEGDLWVEPRERGSRFVFVMPLDTTTKPEQGSSG